MDWLIFVYTIGIILVCFAAAVLSVAAYAVSRKRALIPQAVFFVAYIIEISSILGTEFLSQNLPFSPDNYYEVTTPAVRILTGAAILQSLWLMLLNFLDVHEGRIRTVPICAFVLGCIFVLAALPYGPVRQWLFYTLRQAFTTWGLLYAWLCYKRSSDDAYRTRLERHRHEYLLLWVLLACILAEDAYVILWAPIPDAGTSWLRLYLSERNFSENVMMLFVAYHVIRGSLATLALRFEAPPVQQDGNDLSRHIEDQLPAFATAHKLSPREREVLGLVIEGKDNRSIAQELYLSEGTIKTHVHNIMRKTETSNRDELKQRFWAS